jgi:hypothetical protein
MVDGRSELPGGVGADLHPDSPSSIFDHQPSIIGHPQAQASDVAGRPGVGYTGVRLDEGPKPGRSSFEERAPKDGSDRWTCSPT